MKSRILCVAAIVAVVAFTSGATTQARGGFSDRTLRGVYGFSGSGTIAGGAIPATVVGLTRFDGAGGCAVSARLNAGGAVHALTSTSCSYGVNADGSGWQRIALSGAPFPLPEFISDLVIVDNAREIHFVLSDAGGGTVANGIAKEQTSPHGD